MRLSNFHDIGFSNRSNTCDVMGRVSHNREGFDVAITAVSSWILAATASR
jgi:hypothetical protein